jgi:hypothetical protein
MNLKFIFTYFSFCTFIFNLRFQFFDLKSCK